VAAILVAGGILAYPHLHALRQKADDAPLALPMAPRPPASPTLPSRLPGEADDARLSAFSPRDFGMRSQFRTAVTVNGPFEPLKADVFTNDESSYALDGIRVPPPSAVCLGADKRLWACGLQARAALHGYLRGKTLQCKLVSGQPVRRPRDPGTARWQCTAEGKDIALQMVEGGWARPAGRDERAFLQAEAAAEAQQRGLWDGGWTIARVPETGQ